MTMVVGNVGDPDIHRFQNIVLIKKNKKNNNLEVEDPTSLIMGPSIPPSSWTILYSDHLTILNVVEMIKHLPVP